MTSEITRLPRARLWTAALVATMALAGCGSDEEGGGKGGASEGGAGGRDTQGQDVPGREAQGSEYTVALPEGWRDSTVEASKDSAINFDRVFTAERVEGFAINVNVIRERKPDADLETIVTAGQKQVEGGFGATELSRPEQRELGGDDAFSYTYALETEGKKLRGEQVAAIHEDLLFTATFTAPERAFDDSRRDYEEILDSWEWK